MDRKDKIEKTKDNLKVNQLDDSVRKQLFDKFVESGGKVVTDKQQRKGPLQSRVKNQVPQQRTARKPSDVRKPTIQREAVPKKSMTQPVQPEKDEESGLNRFLKKLMLRLKLKSSGITDFSGYCFNPRFFNKLNKSFKPDMMELQILFLELFKKNPGTGKRIIMRLDAIKPSYYELLEMTGNIFDKMIYDQIVDHHFNFPDVPQKVSELKGQIVTLYKKIYVLFQYESTIYDAFNHAMDLYYAIEGKNADPLVMNKRKVYNSLFTIFHKLLPKLHLLMSHYSGRVLDLYDPRIEAVLGLTDQDKPGKRLIMQLEDDLSLLSNEGDDKQKNASSQVTDQVKAKALKQGLELLTKVNVRSLRREYDHDRVFDNIGDDDPVFLSFMYFTEFDREYSFILTTNKIKYYQDYTSRSRTDNKSRLIDLYDLMRKSFDLFKEYAEEQALYDKSKKEKPINNTQYIEFTKRLESQEKKKNAAGKAAIASVSTFMETLTDELRIIIDDMDSEQKLITNPQDVIEFDVNIEGEKKLNGKKVYEAVGLVYAFGLAYVERMSQQFEKSAVPDNASGETPVETVQKRETHQIEEKKESGEGAHETQEKSVIQELDDLL